MNWIKIKNTTIAFALLTIALLFWDHPVSAAAQADSIPSPVAGSNYLRENYRYRIETLLTYEHLRPNSDYGDWLSGDAMLYAKVHQQVTVFGQLSHHSRDQEGDGQLAAAGAYVDWHPRLSTYTAISRGFGEQYLAEWRFDHDFNIPITPFVLTLGISLIDYEGPQSDRILSIGASWYHNRWITEYRLFKNTSDPGSLDSDTHLFSIGHGEEGWRWLFLKLSLGAQAYQTTTLADPQDVRQDATEIRAYHRHWLGKNWGLMETAGFLSLESGYDKYSVSIGFFKEF